MEYQESQEYLVRTCLKIYQINKKKINSANRNTCKKNVYYLKKKMKEDREKKER